MPHNAIRLLCKPSLRAFPIEGFFGLLWEKEMAHPSITKGDSPMTVQDLLDKIGLLPTEAVRYSWSAAGRTRKARPERTSGGNASRAICAGRKPAGDALALVGFVCLFYHILNGRADLAQEISVWIELAKAIPSVVTAVTAVVGVCIAARGLNKWRTETIGKRKAELAEEVLADFYQARDIIKSARSGSFPHEGATRQKAEWESEEDTRKLNTYFATYERLRNKEEFFAQFYARRYRFMAHFGLQAGEPYDKLRRIYNDIALAVQMLIDTYNQRNLGSLPKNRAAWEATIGWGPPENDKIPGRLDVIVDSVENICRPAIQEAAK
jgi:hypothetical protein